MRVVHLFAWLILASLLPALAPTARAQDDGSDEKKFDQLVERFLDEFAAFSPVSATALGDHRFDNRLDQVSEEIRERESRFCERGLRSLDDIDRERLPRPKQVDYQLLRHYLRKRHWELTRLQEWVWNPQAYASTGGSSVYLLMARDFAPLTTRLGHVADRLEQLPRFLEQVRETLVPERVPAVHAQTAARQTRGVLTMLDEMVRPKLDALDEKERARMDKAIAGATAAVVRHENWLQEELLPGAKGDFRIGLELYEEKLNLTLDTKMTRRELRDLARGELRRVRREMYSLARQVLDGDANELPEEPTREQEQSAIQAALKRAYDDAPNRGEVLDAARHSLKITTEFVRQKDLLTIPDDPLDIIVMPEFQRGVSVAYCDSPGPLEVGQKTFYAVAPLPASWTDEQCRSFLREYNYRSIHNLTIHEAMPGHFLQLAHANRYPGKLRAVAASGVFIEGWACYTEQMMADQGFLDHDPLMKLITLKWYLRSIANTLMDQAIHVEGMSREQAMKLMIEDTFQQEREADGKWTRAQLTSVQLSTYFVGYQQHRAMREAVEEAWGERFDLKRYNDAAISFGSPPVRYVRALILEQPIPE